MQAKLYNQTGEEKGTVELNPKIFGMEKIKPDVVHQAVVSLLSARRSAVAHSKTRGEVRGGGKKPHAQKGTGRARAGSIRSPLWRGGGITFGPRMNRNWELKLNKKMKTQVLFSVLSDKVKTGKLVILENLNLSSPKTRVLGGVLGGLMAKIPTLGKRLTLVTSDGQRELARAGKNLSHLIVMPASSLNILDILSAPNLVVMRDALPVIEKTYLKNKDQHGTV